MIANTNIVLTGMPACGKSTIGVLLAKARGMDFLDTDIMIQRQCGATLSTLIEHRGIDAFLEIEEAALTGLHCENTCIATGGSAVYSDTAMHALKQRGRVVYIELPYDEIARRIGDIVTRGVVRAPGKTLRDVYAERVPLYEQYADVTIHAAGLSVEALVEVILRSV